MKRGLVSFTLVSLLAFTFAALCARADVAEQWVQYAAQQYKAQQYDDSIASYKKALKANPRSAAAYQGIGNCLLGKGDTAGAVTNYKYSLQINPNNTALASYVSSLAGSTASAEPVAQAQPSGDADKFYKYGNQYVASKQYDYAISWYNKSLQLDPNSAKTNQAMGGAYFFKGDRQKALEYFDKALAADPSNTTLKAYADRLRGSSEPGQGGSAKAPAGSSNLAYIMGGSLFLASVLMIFLF